ncbi:GIY-YIG nuclease family protein [Actinomyces ruminicola]|uniref:GIY-YIG nuclease family protein n=1 Tax=Actinomyces ruminicola TaxID=332524 RepID=UPI0011CC73C3|nr:GIY-YIG nuclease family protein [Actinomyces ruminicola]
MTQPRTIQLFLVDGDPRFRIKATLSNWTGLVYSLPRTCLDNDPARPDLEQTGVYLLFGTNDETGQAQVYVGQARERANGKGILGRIYEHVTTEDGQEYFTHVIAVTTQNDSFGPTEISYLENRFYRMAADASRYKVTNGNCPSPGKVTEEKEAELEEFIGYARTVIGALGYKVFEPLDDAGANAQSTSIDVHPAESSENTLELKRKGTLAYGRQTTDGFVVLAGSRINAEMTSTCPPSARNMREKYDDAIEDYVTTKDLLFNSPSGAACFVGGASLNGKEAWKDSQGRNLNQIEETEVRNAVQEH